MPSRVLVGLTVTDALAYVWREVLEAVGKLDWPDLRYHGVFHRAPSALDEGGRWKADRQATEDCLSEPSPGTRHNWRGYDDHGLTVVMAVQEKLRQAFLHTDAEWLFSVECDQIVEPDTLRVLMETGLPLVMAATPARHAPELMNCTLGTVGKLRCPPVDQFAFRRTVPVTSVALGCTLIRRDLLEAVGWEDPEALMRKYHNGGDVAFSCEVTEKLGVVPHICMGTTAVHVQKLGSTLHYYWLAANTVEKTVVRTKHQ